MKEPSAIKKLIKQGEGIEIEFKKSEEKLSRDVFETVCAFLNRIGGHLLLGVDDYGKIVGVSNPEKVLNEFVTLSNNSQKLQPTFYFSPEIITVEGREIIYVYIPASSQVHKTNGKIFDRNDDGDFDITNNSELVGALYLRKQTAYSENKIFPFATMQDLRSDLIDRVRKMARIEAGDEHLFGRLSDEEILKSLSLFQHDYITGKSGLTLAAILLFGKDETIMNVLPHHRTDAIVRKIKTDRYDDRDDIRTNLLESYDRLMAFVKKHLPDPFYLEDDKRISLRNKIFREAIVNILIHREFINPFPSKMIIKNSMVEFENASRPHGYGLIRPESFSPFPKNPKIARVFKEIGLADELGSGVRNIFKYSKIYSGKEPRLVEGDIFRIEIALPESTEQVTEQPTEQVTEQVTMQAVVEFCREPKSTKEIMEFLQLKHREYVRSEIIKPLLEKDLLKMTMPDKPNNPKQKYYSVKKTQGVKDNVGVVYSGPTEQVTEQPTEQVTEQVTIQAVVEFCREPKSTKEIMEFLQLKHREYVRSEIIKPLLEKDLLKMTMPDKPNNPKQKYSSKIK